MILTTLNRVMKSLEDKKSITVYSYGFMIAIGVISALLLSLYRAKRLGFDRDAVMDLRYVLLYKRTRSGISSRPYKN